MAAAELLLASTSTLTVATGVLNIWMHNPVQVAREHLLLQAAYADRFLLGLGVGHPRSVNLVEEGLYKKPFSAMSSFLDALDHAAPTMEPRERILAALRPRMLSLAGTRSLGAHTYFVPVDHTRRSRAALGPGPSLAVEQAVLLDADRGRARRRAREHLSRYLDLPNYTGNLRLLGFDDTDFAHGGSEHLVDELVVWGDEDKIKARIDAQFNAGADHVCIQVIGVDDHVLPTQEWERLAGALC
jgi:probable F420-dependent oxidoreductase